MQKVLIISYFFPPCNLSASHRAFAWACHLKEFGYYPTIITRSWEKEIKAPMDAFNKSGNRMKHEKFKNYEVFYLPYLPSLRDKIYTKYGDAKCVRIRKLLTLFELLTQYITNFFIPFNNIYKFTAEYLKKNNINKVIITANPFILFKFGFILKKKLNVKWIADYRDDWNTQQLINKNSIIQKLMTKLESYYEKKWVGTSELITSISDNYIAKISKFVEKPGITILHGYAEEDLPPDTDNDLQLELFNDFTIVYNGSLYPTQKIEIFLTAVKHLIDFNKRTVKIKLLFPGLAYDAAQKNRVAEFMKEYSTYLTITDRIPKNEVITIQKKAHLMLMISHINIKGVPSGKLYEYIGLNKPILLCPGDDDIIENTLRKTGLGYFANTIDDASNILDKLYRNFLEGRAVPVNPNLKEIKALSMKNQTKKLSEVLDGNHGCSAQKL